MTEANFERPWALLVTRNFPPLVGGMERLNAHLLAALAGEWRPALCGPAGSAAHVPAGADVQEAPLRPLPRFVLATALAAWRLARRLRPVHVVAGSGLAAPMAWLAARASGARFTVYLHGLDVIAPSRVYQWAWLPFVRAADGVLVNSHHTGALARGRGVQASRIAVLHPGVESTVAADADGARFRGRHDLGDGPLLLSVGRLTPRKGLVEFIERALPAIVARQPDAVLAVVGEEAHDALHGGGGAQRARIEAAARAVGLTDRVRLVGRCDEATLADAYRAADCHVFPVLDLPGDVEGFGMVALEAAAHGVPTVAFAVGGVPDAVMDGRTGALVAPGDYAAFAAATLAQLETPDRKDVAERCRGFARSLDWAVFGARLRALLRGADA